MKKEYAKYLWVEFYRPKSIKEMILPRKTKMFFTKLVNRNEIPHLLLHSNTPGTGKTTLSKCIANDMQADYLYINASQDTGIDMIRTKVKKFAMTKSMSGKHKIVILDEIDSNSNISMQKSLRGFMEEYHRSCRFILTCNYLTKIIDPLKSRCEIIDFDMTDKKVRDEMQPMIYKRIIKILDHKKIDYKEEIIKKLISEYYPDIRSMIKLCQQYSDVYDCITEEIFSTNHVDKKFFDLIMAKQFNKARKYVIERNLKYSELYRLLYDKLVPEIKKDKPRAIVYISDYMYKDAFVIDKEINFAACLIELMQDCI